MLSEKSRPIIEATLPIIADRIGHITPDFYERMFAARPDLMDDKTAWLIRLRSILKPRRCRRCRRI